MKSAADLPTYSNYVPSGSTWIGDVPAHWQVVPLGRLGRLQKGVGGTKEDEIAGGIPCIRYGDLYTRHQYFIKTSRSFVSTDKAAGYTSINYGDVLFAGSGETLEEIGKSAVNLLESPAVCGGDVLVLRPTAFVDPRFLGYAADYAGAARQKACLGRGVTVMHLYADDLKYALIALPPLDEQAAIVRYLGALDQRLGRLVRTKRRLMTLLRGQQQQIIEAAVLRGINTRKGRRVPNAPWLGMIPEDWEAKRAKWYFREVDERSESGAEELLSVSHITGVTRRSEKNVTMFKAESYAGHKLCRPGDLVVNTMWAWMGALGTALERGIVSPAYAVYRPAGQELFDSRFVDYLLRTRTYVAEYVRRSTGIRSSRLRLYPPQFLDVLIVRPPLEQQRAIVDLIERSTAELGDAISTADREIELLLEYRARITFDVVSGKRDVRAAAEGLAEPDLSDNVLLDLDTELGNEVGLDADELLDEVLS